MKLNYFTTFLFCAAFISACTTNKITPTNSDAKNPISPEFKSEGGSSGMEQIDDWAKQRGRVEAWARSAREGAFVRVCQFFVSMSLSSFL